MQTSLSNKIKFIPLIITLLLTTTNPLLAVPINDNLCDATPILPNGSCTPGTTIDATPDYEPDGWLCQSIDHSTVYYEVPTGPGANGLIIDINGFDGNIAVSLWSLNVDCNNAPTMLDYYCGDAIGFPDNFYGVEENTTYIIQVSTGPIDEGSFELCVSENLPVPGCAENDICLDAETLTVLTGEDCVPVSGCNNGAAPELDLDFCIMDRSSIVWYFFETDATAGLLNVVVESDQIIAPTITLFTGDCSDLTRVSSCIQGNNGTAEMSNRVVMPNTGYYLAVGQGFGIGGEFEICVSTINNQSSCVLESNIFIQPGSPSMGSSVSGPFKPGETVEVCMEITEYFASATGDPLGNNCQWLQGIVPVFGNGWDLSNFDPTIHLPPNLYTGFWSWYEDGITCNSTGTVLTVDDFDGDGVNDICHNSEDSCPNSGIAPGTIVPPGWFAADSDISDPNSTFGDGNCCNCQMGPWVFCFELTTVSLSDCEADSSALDCSIKMYTFADGETGSWAGGPSVCALDVPAIFSASINCSDQIAAPIVVEEEVCSGQLFSIQPTSNNVEEHFYVWNAENNNNGATSGFGQVINQLLVNETPDPLIVNLEVYAVEKATGAQSATVLMPITVLPKVITEITDYTDPICPGACIDLVSSAVGGSGNFVSYIWDGGLSPGQTTNDCPLINTTYSLTVTDDKGCFGSDTMAIALDLNYQDSTFLFQTSCDPSEAGVVVGEYQNQFGCDSIVITVTELLESNTTNLEGTTCDPAESGLFEFVFANQNGCDSIVTLVVSLMVVPATPLAPEDIVIPEAMPFIDLSIPEVPGATEYIWTVPTGVQILSGQSTTAISLNWDIDIDGEVCVSAVNSCGSSDADCTNVSIDFEIGLNDLHEDEFIVYPSPAKEYLYVDFENSESYEVSLIDVLGRVVLSSASHSQRAELFVGDLVSGVYWMRVAIGGEVYWKQVGVE